MQRSGRDETRRASLPADPCARSAARCVTREPGKANSKAKADHSCGLLSPLPRAGEGGASAPGEGALFGSVPSPSRVPSLPACGGTLSRSRERGTSS